MNYELFRNLTQDQANTCGLVLTSSGILYSVRKGETGWHIMVSEADHENAIGAIRKYFDENQDFNLENRTIGFRYQKTFSGLWASLILLVCHIIFVVNNGDKTITRKFGSSAADILDGEFYRTATSLMLHANALHLIGNMAGIALFGTAVCSITGWGVGWFLILLAGMGGNLLNAFLFKTGHLSIGASTAVFGAIGILAGNTFFEKYQLGGRRIKAWLPIGGGLALLGFLGAGKNTDITAHLFGFISGILIGAVYAYLIKYPLPKNYQTNCLIITISLIVMSWLRGMG